LPCAPRETASRTGRSARHVSASGRLLPDLYRHYGIDANTIAAAAQSIAPGRPIRHLKALP